MGLLALVFTLAILITTGRIYRMVETSLRLQNQNRDLVEDLRSANQETAALNQALELRVQERTAERSHRPNNYGPRSPDVSRRKKNCYAPASWNLSGYWPAASHMTSTTS